MIDIVKTELPGVLILEPRVFGDERGYFFESFNEKELREKTGLDVRFVQDNESKSRYGVLRGLHFQRPPFAQSKLLSVVQGKVLDVAVDLRRGSATYGKYLTCELSAENHRRLFLPKGMAHGYVVLSEEAVFQYKCDEFYHPEAEGGIAWDDEEIGIPWPVSADEVVLSARDRRHPRLKEFESPFEI